MKTTRVLAVAVALVTTAAWAQQTTEERRDDRADMGGIRVMAGGGVEGYLGGFRGQVNPGPAWSVVAGVDPWSALGFEVGYSGAVNNLTAEISQPGGAVNGADLVRNGGHAAVIVGLPLPLQPYAMGGIGLDRYTWRGTEGELGYRSDTSGSVPLGAGLRTNLGGLSADLRFTYEALFNDNFSPVDSNFGDGRYSGLLQVGGKF